MDVSKELFEDSCNMLFWELISKYSNLRYIYGPDTRGREKVYGDLVRIEEGDFELYKPWSGEMVEGDSLYYILLVRTMQRRILRPDTNVDELYLNLLYDCYSEKRITKEKVQNKYLAGIAIKVMSMGMDEVEKSCEESVNLRKEYFKKNHKTGYKSTTGNKEDYKEYNKYQSLELSIKGMPVKEIAKTTGLSERTIRGYGYKDSNNPRLQDIKFDELSRQQQYRIRKQRGEVLQRPGLDKLKELYPTLRGDTIAKTRENFKDEGYQVSEQMLRKLEKEYRNEVYEPEIQEEEVDINKVSSPGFLNGFGDTPYCNPTQEENERKESEEPSGFSGFSGFNLGGNGFGFF